MIYIIKNKKIYGIFSIIGLIDCRNKIQYVIDAEKRFVVQTSEHRYDLKVVINCFGIFVKSKGKAINNFN